MQSNTVTHTTEENALIFSSFKAGRPLQKQPAHISPGVLTRVTSCGEGWDWGDSPQRAGGVVIKKPKEVKAWSPGHPK